ncbi:MAG: PmoA family protein [Saprospiraceae bacterium]|nr:PmoA family protein [Saprospiraceae bacterium]
MNSNSIYWLMYVLLVAVACTSKPAAMDKVDASPQVLFEADSANKLINVNIDGKLFTSFRWHDNLTKPILYPIYTSDGTEITRGFPLNPRAGERVDHPHQIGMWLTYGNVNGTDFWGNGSRGLGTKNSNGGFIKHQKVDRLSEGTAEGILITSENWADSVGTEVLKERTEYHFVARDSVQFIDRITTLTAGSGEDVSLPDTKEGMFGIRVARQLELPAQGEMTLYSADGHPEKVEAANQEDISGNYRSSEGISGLEVWGTRARWMDLSGTIDGRKISLVICDHPDNPSYPTWWHARGYGLFSANPLGAKDFTRNEEMVNFSIKSGASVTFRYRVLISSGFYLSEEQINVHADAFAAKY